MATKLVPATDEEIKQANETLAAKNPPLNLPPAVTHMNKILIVLCRPVLKMPDGHVKYGQVPGGTFTWDLNRKDYRGFVRWKSKYLYRCVIEEPAMFSTQGLGIVYYDVEGCKPLNVMIEDVPNQVESRKAESVFGIDTMQKAFGAMNPNKSSNIAIYVILSIMMFLMGLIADHFLHF